MREHFFMALTSVDAKTKETQVRHANIDHIMTMAQTQEGVIVTMVDGSKFLVIDSVIDIERRAKQYGVMVTV